MSEYWLISAPAETTRQRIFDDLNRVTNTPNLSENYKFAIPDFKVGSLDLLIMHSDDLSHLDAHVEKIARNVAVSLGDVLECGKEKLGENLKANQMTLGEYVSNFNWDRAKYPASQSIKVISDIITKQVNLIERDLSSKSGPYKSLKINLKNIEAKETGSLMTRNLSDLVQKEHFVLNSEYLTTILVVVPKSYYADWKSKYETMTDMVVPRSSQLIYEDKDHGLFTVTLFHNVKDEFKYKAGKERFIVRDFVFDERAIAESKKGMKNLIKDKKNNYGPLVRWLKVNFSECFCAWIHVKALRVFVESVLRYGVPVNFQAILVHPNPNSVKILRNVLNEHYEYLDKAHHNETKDDNTFGLPDFGFSQADYFSYVSIDVNIDILNPKKKVKPKMFHPTK